MREQSAINPPGWQDYVEQTKRAITDYIAPTRDFASAILPETANLNVACLKEYANSEIYVAANKLAKIFI